MRITEKRIEREREREFPIFYFTPQMATKADAGTR